LYCQKRVSEARKETEKPEKRQKRECFDKKAVTLLANTVAQRQGQFFQDS
jgi:hypothetical protein